MPGPEPGGANPPRTTARRPSEGKGDAGCRDIRLRYLAVKGGHIAMRFLLAVSLPGCTSFSGDEVERDAAAVESRLGSVVGPERPGVRSLTQSKDP